MNMHRIAVFLAGAAFSLSVRADVLVPAGATLSVTNTESLGIGGSITMGAGATLAFAGPASASAGLNEYTRTNAASVGTPNASAYGTWTRITTNVYWASSTITNAQTEYVYTGRWHVPSAGLYSFYEFIDDMDSIAVDGTVVLQSAQWNDATCARNVALTAGWHDLELRAYNGAASGGMVTNLLASGFLYSPSNDLISVTNLANALPFVDVGDGASLLSVHNGTIGQKVVLSGLATFDLTQQGLDAPLSIIGGLWPQPSSNAYLTVSGGTGSVLFGGPNTGVSFAPFNADVTFAGVSSPAGVTFRDYSTVVAWPTSCTWRIADNATVALYGTNMLGSGDVTLTNFNIYVLSPFACTAGSTVHVQGTNRTVYIKPCTIDTNGNWSGANVVVTNNVSLEGVNPTAHFPINVNVVLQGAIAGTGTVTKAGAATAEITGPNTFVGPVSVTDTGTLIFDSPTAGDSNNAVTVGAGATFSLYPAGYGTNTTAASIKTLHGGGATAKVSLPAKQTMTVDFLDGTITVQGAGSSLCVNYLSTNATLLVSGQTAVTLNSAAAGAKLTLSSGASLSAPGVTLESLVLASGSIPVSGSLTVNVLGGSGRLVKSGTDAMTVYFSTNTVGAQVDAGILTLSPPPTNAVLGSLPALWLDAAASNTLTQYKTYAFTNGFINIERWNDRRPDAPYYGYNSRGNDNRQVYPYVATNCQNGLPVVSMGSYQLTLTDPYIGPDGGGIEARRLPLSTNLYPQYAFMVYGSQFGGGAAVLGGNAAFYRAGSTAADFRNPATPIFASTGASYPVWTNGVAITATNTGFTSGYQILSVNTKGQLVNAIGWRTDPGSAGGANYGELLFFTNSLSTVERLTVEAYLAGKWALPFAYACSLSNITVAAGATLQVGSTYTIERLSGSGTVIASSGASVLSGYFTGAITVSNGTFTVPSLPLPPKADGISTASLSCWFDPSVTNRVVFGGAYTPGRPLSVAALYDRTTTNRYLFGSCNTDLSYDRRPWLSATNGPTGETQYWLDYSNYYGDSNGNTLRLYRNSAYIGANNVTGNHTPTNVQSGFIVLDSSRGGGVPITYDVTASSVFTRSSPQTVSSPIWASSSADAVKYGQTYLDGASVSGTTRGYSGTTELLSFVTTNAVQAAFFGWYGGDGTSGNLNRERLGEIILFDTALSDSARASVEAYLMAKWLGKARSGYSDFSSATVAGSGSITANSLSQLPMLSAGFTGNAVIKTNVFAFTFSTNAVGQYTVSRSVSFPASLTVPASGTVSVTFLVKPKPGAYTLLSYGSATGTGFTGWNLSSSGSAPSDPVRLRATAASLSIMVIPQGTLMSVR